MNNQTLAQLSFSAVKELNDRVAATCSGGVAYTGGSDPDIILFRDGEFNGDRPLAINASIGDGISNVGDDFNDVTSSFVILRGTWNFYQDDQYRGYEGNYGPGAYGVLPEGIVNDSITSLQRVG